MHLCFIVQSNSVIHLFIVDIYLRYVYVLQIFYTVDTSLKVTYPKYYKNLFSVFVFEQIWLSGSGSTKKKLTQCKMGFFGRLKHTKLILYVRAYIFIVLEIHNFELLCNHIWITIPRDCSGFELSSCNKLLFRLIKEISWHS